MCVLKRARPLPLPLLISLHPRRPTADSTIQSLVAREEFLAVTKRADSGVDWEENNSRFWNELHLIALITRTRGLYHSLPGERRSGPSPSLSFLLSLQPPPPSLSTPSPLSTLSLAQTFKAHVCPLATSCPQSGLSFTTWLRPKKFFMRVREVKFAAATIVISRFFRGIFDGVATNKHTTRKKVFLTFGCVLLGNATFGSIWNEKKKENISLYEDDNPSIYLFKEWTI